MIPTLTRVDIQLTKPNRNRLARDKRTTGCAIKTHFNKLLRSRFRFIHTVFSERNGNINGVQALAD